MGERGPVPKRSEDRKRRNAPAVALTQVDGAPKVTIPNESREWHPVAKRMWKALKESGQSRFYESSDWAFAYSLMEDLSFYKSSGKRSGQMLSAILDGLAKLLVTEGDRRRVGIELARPSSEELESAGVVEMREWQKKLVGGGS